MIEYRADMILCPVDGCTWFAGTHGETEQECRDFATAIIQRHVAEAHGD